MSKNVFYRHCRLVKPIPTGEKITVSWFPDQFAVQGKVLKLRDDNGKWEDGWVVRNVSESRLSEGEVPNFHSEIKSHRKATGDSMPKV